MAKSKKQEELEQQVGELTLDLQRTRADFENYRKRSEQEKKMAQGSGRASAIIKLLPMIDNIDRALTHLPEELEGNAWAQSVVKLSKTLEKSLSDMNVEKIAANRDDVFNPDLHDAVQFDEESDGEHEVIDEVLQSGYRVDGVVMRPAMVKVVRK